MLCSLEINGALAALLAGLAVPAWHWQWQLPRPHPLTAAILPPCIAVLQVAAALEFFLRPENDFITGQVLAVDGGLSTLHPHRAQEYGV
jgi:NAD(P)-dependent dehydrogenase (short-subunit alcohol dehydrogenase family)